MSTSSRPVARGSDFAPLMQAVRDSGLLRPRRWRYALLISLDLIPFVAVWIGVCLLGSSWWAIFLAAPAAVFATRVVFIGHDVSHRQVARTARTNHAIALFVGDLLSGFGARWWVDKHSRHHANPNLVGRDPDVGPGAMVWTPAQAASRSTRAGIWLRRNQARLYFPLLLLEAFNLRFGSLRAIRRARDLVLPLMHIAIYLGGLVLVLGPGKAAVFALAHQALLGLHLGCAFAPGHKGMPMPGPGELVDFLRRQVVTTRNVRGGPVVDWFLGGLNYQIEHHLFPGMPRPNLRAAQTFVRAHCARLDLSYVEETFRTSMVLTLRHLHRTGAAS